MHALNNIVGCNQYSLEFTREACHEVTLETGESAGDHAPPSGDWSFKVVAKAVELTVPPLRRVPVRPVVAGDLVRFINSNEVRRSTTNVTNSHWVAQAKVGQRVFLVDSLHWPSVIAEHEFKRIISSQLASVFVAPRDATFASATAGASPCTVLISAVWSSFWHLY